MLFFAALLAVALNVPTADSLDSNVRILKVLKGPTVHRFTPGSARVVERPKRFEACPTQFAFGLEVYSEIAPSTFVCPSAVPLLRFDFGVLSAEPVPSILACPQAVPVFGAYAGDLWSSAGRESRHEGQRARRSNAVCQ